ncbi:ScbA/BarX family gamma-butyrolactone biosynthesis protein [Streptomyces sp. NPDC052309]|uniref:ScbA/BarX family gamma-butyrolactone biosynthesis protein n=1 Tax=Streptomyces sp. NPDC052309 TaxID=3155421 RepID=UPI00343B8418
MPVVEQPALASVESAVPARYVHKRDAAEVLLTGWSGLRPDSFIVSARWPRTHRFYAGQAGLHDPMLFAESVRQCFPLLSHTGFDVPFDHHLVWQYLSFEVVPTAMAVEDGPAVLDLFVTCSDIRRSRGRVAALTFHVVGLRDGVHLGTAQARFSVHPPSVYRRLRGPHADAHRAAVTAGRPPAPVPAALVGRADARDVVLSPSDRAGRWTLRNDTAHPVLFDHPVDHSPGMLLLEAARQAAHAACGPRGVYPVGFESTFLQFAEFDTPCHVTAQPLPAGDASRHRVEVLASQGGRNVFSSVVTALAV